MTNSNPISEDNTTIEQWQDQRHSGLVGMVTSDTDSPDYWISSQLYQQAVRALSYKLGVDTHCKEIDPILWETYKDAIDGGQFTTYREIIRWKQLIDAKPFWTHDMMQSAKIISHPEF